MIGYAGEAILHAAIAAIVVESLLRLWRIRRAAERLHLRLVALLCPIVLPPAFALAAPFRAGDHFATTWALFAGQRWNELQPAGVGLFTAGTIVLAVIGLGLFLRDAGGFVVDRVSRDSPMPPSPERPEVMAFEDLVRRLAGRSGIQAPAVSVIDLGSPVLLCAGVVRPSIVVSTDTLARLDPAELDAAVTHELAHVAHRDPLTGWMLMALRAVQAFNPIAQIVGRQVVQEIEWRADTAVVAAGRAAPLVRALRKLSAQPRGSGFPAERLGLSGRVAATAARTALDARCDRLEAAAGEPACSHPAIRTAVAAAGLAALLFFVV